MCAVTLGIETSCDETSVALVGRDGTVYSNLIASQIERHQPFGGVVPEIASREHLEQIMPLLFRALESAACDLSSVESVAVTNGPGLIGAVLVGVAAAQGLSYGLSVPLVPVNHLEGHIVSSYLNREGPATPFPERFLALVVSGGHSSLYDVTIRGGRRHIQMLNRTRDDAAGEVFDKVAKVIGLPYPGGPHIDRLAAEGDRERFRFPVAQFKDDSADFSFSGLKASAIRVARESAVAAGGDEQQLRDFCAGFQAAVVDQILDRLSRLWETGTIRVSELALAGGVAANGELRQRLAAWGEQRNVVVRLAERRYCTDNAAMIAFAGLHKDPVDATRVKASSRLVL